MRPRHGRYNADLHVADAFQRLTWGANSDYHASLIRVNCDFDN